MICCGVLCCAMMQQLEDPPPPTIPLVPNEEVKFVLCKNEMGHYSVHCVQVGLPQMSNSQMNHHELVVQFTHSVITRLID